MSSAQTTPGYRDFAGSPRDGVRALYAAHHAGQTLDFVLARKAEYLPLRHARMGVWDAFAALDRLVDESDPDLGLSQTQHALQTAEALRRDAAPRWLVLTGLVHDLGKVLCTFGEPQWAVVGDTYPVGCRFSDDIVYPELLEANPDRAVPERSTSSGIYEPGCGLDRVHFTWGHDEYLFHVLRPYLPQEALDIVRYHSFYAGHAAGAYRHLFAPRDHATMELLVRFRRYDLYSKSDRVIDPDAVRGYYEDLVSEFLPDTLAW